MDKGDDNGRSNDKDDGSGPDSDDELKVHQLRVH